MTMQKKEKKPVKVKEPDAFKKNFLPIVEDDRGLTMVAKVRPTKGYSMGALYISYSPPLGTLPAMLMVNHPHRLPTWDELVWIRYQVCPEIEYMACILPPLDQYINYSDGRPKYTMTMESITPEARVGL